MGCVESSSLLAYAVTTDNTVFIYQIHCKICKNIVYEPVNSENAISEICLKELLSIKRKKMIEKSCHKRTDSKLRRILSFRIDKLNQTPPIIEKKGLCKKCKLIEIKNVLHEYKEKGIKFYS